MGRFADGRDFGICVPMVGVADFNKPRRY